MSSCPAALRRGRGARCPRLIQVLAPALLLQAAGACSLLFGTAEPSQVADAGIIDASPALDAPNDAGARLPIIEWSTAVDGFSPVGASDDGTTAMLAGTLAGSAEFNGAPLVPNGESDIVFLSLALDSGEVVSAERMGGVGDLTLMSYDSSEGRHSLAGLYHGPEELCPIDATAACEVNAENSALNAFATLYSDVPTASAAPIAVATFGVANPAGSAGPNVSTFVYDSLASSTRNVVVGSYRRGITVSGTTEFANSDLATENLFVANTGLSGEAISSIAPDAAGRQFAWAVEASGLGNIYVVGTYEGSVDFGIPGATVLPKTSDPTLFVLHSNPSLSNALWSLPIAIGVSGFPVFAAAAGDGSLYISGSYIRKLDVVGAGELEAPSGSENAFLLKISSAGEILWVKNIGGAGNARVRGLQVTSGGDIVLGGEFFGELPLPMPIGTLKSAGNLDGFAMRLNADGDPLWGATFGGTVEGIGDVDRVGGVFATSDDAALVHVRYESTQSIAGQNVGPGFQLFKLR